MKFVKSDENEADIFTKNTTNTILQNHQKKLVQDKGKVNKDESPELTQNEIQQEGCCNLNQIRTDRQTVGLRFSSESVSLRRSPVSDLPHLYLWMVEPV